MDDGRSHPTEPLESLLEPLLGPAYGIALRYTRNPTEAEDLVQEAAFQAVRGFSTFQPGTNFKAWFFKILTNCFYQSHRRRRREPEWVDVEDAPELYLFLRAREHGLLREGEDPAARVLGRIEQEHIVAAIESLPEEFRMACALYFMEDLRYQEIAEILDVPVGTVRSRLHRGRRLLQKALWQIARERGLVPEEGMEERT